MAVKWSPGCGCCESGCALWIAELPAVIDESNPPVNFVDNAGVWVSSSSLPNSDWILVLGQKLQDGDVLAIKNGADENLLSITCTLQLSPGWPTVGRWKYVCNFGSASPVNVYTYNDKLRISCSNGALMIRTESTNINGGFSFSETNEFPINPKTAVQLPAYQGRSFKEVSSEYIEDLETGSRVLCSPDVYPSDYILSKTVRPKLYLPGFVIPVSVSGPFYLSLDLALHREVDVTATRVENTLTETREDCNRPMICSFSSHFYSQPRFKADLVLPHTLTEVKRFTQHNACESTTEIQYAECDPITYRPLDYKERINFGTFASNHPADLPHNPDRSFACEPRITQTKVTTQVIAEDRIAGTRRLKITVLVAFVGDTALTTTAFALSGPTKDTSGIDPVYAVGQWNGGTVKVGNPAIFEDGFAFGGPSLRLSNVIGAVLVVSAYNILPDGFDGDNDLACVSYFYQSFPVFPEFGSDSQLGAYSLFSDIVEFELDVPIWDGEPPTINVTLGDVISGYTPRPEEPVSGRAINITSVTETLVSPDLYAIKWEGSQSISTVPLNLMAATLELTPADDFAFPVEP